MGNPPTSSITDVIVPFGYGAFGYGYGTYGGATGVINPQWNTNSGNFGFDPLTKTPYVQASANPSFVGASLYSIQSSSFFAKIVPAPPGNGTVQTSLVIQANKYNFVEMFIAPNGQFNAYVANNAEPALLNSPFPTYDPTAHAYWRIRDDNSSTFHFDVSPDATTWTEIGAIDYHWDSSAVSVIFLAGYNGNDETQNLLAHISNVNLNVAVSILSATGRDHSSISGALVVSSPNALSGSVAGHGGKRSDFQISLGIPEGGMTDYITSIPAVPDPLRTRNLINNIFTPISGGNPFFWFQQYVVSTAPTKYRDGSYWPPAVAASGIIGTDVGTDSVVNLLTNTQLEKVPTTFNRLTPDASFYIDSCPYSATKSGTPSGNGGVTSMTRSSDKAIAGNYSGKMVYSGTPIVDGGGRNVYYALPTKSSLSPVSIFGGIMEDIVGTVSLNTTRAGTQWYAGLVFYDANYTLIANTTFQKVSGVQIHTHPGGGTWQSATTRAAFPVDDSPIAAWVGVVAVVVAPGGSETTYMSGHTINKPSPTRSIQPATYEDPQTINITLKANRVNYALNSGFNQDLFGWTTSASGTPTNLCTVTWDGTVGLNSLGSMKASYAGGSLSSGSNFPGVGPASYIIQAGNPSIPVVQGLKAGHTYNFSAWVKQGPNCPDVTMSIEDPNYAGVFGISVNQVKNTIPTESVNGWTRVQHNFVVPAGGSTDFRIWFAVAYSDITSLSPFSFWVDNILVEEVLTAGDYFDGGFAPADYQYELGGNQNSRSHYYLDFTNKLNRIKVALPNYSPVGSSFNILSAQPPS